MVRKWCELCDGFRWFSCRSPVANPLFCWPLVALELVEAAGLEPAAYMHLN